MRRGPITLLKAEVEYAAQLVADPAAPLVHKLTAGAANGKDQAQVELSEQEAEQLLDALPAPGQQVDSAELIENLRDKLLNFFKQL